MARPDLTGPIIVDDPRDGTDRKAAGMSEFNWGDPHPLPVDRRKRKRRADERATRWFAAVLVVVSDGYERGEEAVGRAAFD
jgi:hypothetical protein